MMMMMMMRYLLTDLQVRRSRGSEVQEGQKGQKGQVGQEGQEGLKRGSSIGGLHGATAVHTSGPNRRALASPAAESSAAYPGP